MNSKGLIRLLQKLIKSKAAKLDKKTEKKIDDILNKRKCIVCGITYNKGLSRNTNTCLKCRRIRRNQTANNFYHRNRNKKIIEQGIDK